MSFVVGDRVRFEPQNFCEGAGRTGTIIRKNFDNRWTVVWDIPQKKTNRYTAVNLALIDAAEEFTEDLV